MLYRSVLLYCRTLKALTTPQFLDLLTSAQEGIAKGEAPPAWMNETQFFWLPQTQQVCGFSGWMHTLSCVGRVIALTAVAIFVVDFFGANWTPACGCFRRHSHLHGCPTASTAFSAADILSAAPAASAAAMSAAVAAAVHDGWVQQV